MNWLSEVPGRYTCEAQIRYRQAPQKCEIIQRDEYTDVTFSASQRAITPGQVCALYDGERVV